MIRNIIFEKLDFSTLLLCIFFKLINQKIYYRQRSKLFKKRSTEKILSLFKIKELSYANLSHSAFIKSMSNTSVYENKLIKEKISENIFIKNFINKEKLDSNKEKVYRAVCNNLGNFKVEFSSIYLINYYLKNKSLYFPNTLQSLIVLKNHTLENIFVSGTHVYINIIFSELIKKKNLLHKFREYIVNFNQKKTKLKKNSDNFKLIYFPHDSLVYGEKLFSKTFIYKIKKKSKSLKNNILTVFFDSIRNFDKKFFYLNNINYIIFNNETLIKKIKIISFLLKEIFNNKNILSKDNFWLNLSIFNFIFKYYKSIDFLSKFPNLKAVYIYYDILFYDNAFLIACEKKKISTIAHLERGILAWYNSPLFFNHYIVPSIKFKKVLEKKKYLIDNYHNFGFLRQKLVFNKHIKKKNLYKKLILNKKKKKIILCIGTLISDNDSVNFTANKGNSLSANIKFLKDIIKLSEKYLDCYFIIKYKDYSFLRYINIKNFLKNKKNVELLNNYHQINTYELINMSDLIISKYSSILDEVISLKKKIICYDNEGDLKFTGYVFNFLNICTYNFSQLNNKFIHFLKKNRYYSTKQIKLINFYFGKKRLNVESKIIQLVSKII